MDFTFHHARSIFIYVKAIYIYIYMFWQSHVEIQVHVKPRSQLAVPLACLLALLLLVCAFFSCLLVHDVAIAEIQ